MVNALKTGRQREKRLRTGIPRTPARGRGVVRYDALVDATEFLLQTEDPGDVGLYRIAEQAKVPPASVYHFFPTREAAFTALALRIMEQLRSAHRMPLRAREVTTWQNLFRADCRRGMMFFNSHPAALKIFYGGFGGVDERRVEEAATAALAQVSYDRLNSIFYMPHMQDPETRFTCRLAILDAIWSVSVRKSGVITDAYFEEAMHACIGYSRTFLPDRLELREEFAAIAEADGEIHIHYDQFSPVEIEGEKAESAKSNAALQDNRQKTV